jgi:ribose transport system substrate-binding protein
MKKLSALFLAVLLVFGMTACRGKTAEAGAAGGGTKPIVGLSLQNMDTTLAVALYDRFAERLGNDYDVQVASADNDPTRQISQIENFITMGVKMIVTMPIEMSGLAGACRKAVDAGILVYSVGADPREPGVVTHMTLLNQYLTAQYCIEMARDWIEETFPDAPDNSVELAIFADSSVPELIERINAFHQIKEPYLRNLDGDYVNYENEVVPENRRVPNPVYCSKVKLLPDIEAPFLQSGITAMQNLLVSNPNIRVIIGTNTNSAMGASQAVMDDYNKGAGAVIRDLSRIAGFGVSVMEPEEQALFDSAAGDGIIRGAIAFGGSDLVDLVVDYVRDILEDPGNAPKIDWIEISRVTVKDGKRVDEVLPKEGTPQPR